jgi:putative oxidoreductase
MHMSNRLFDRLLTNGVDFGPLALRAPVGPIFAARGAQKLFGWFGGDGLEGTGQDFASVGLNPGYLMALLAGAVALLGGLALMLSLLVRQATGIAHGVLAMDAFVFAAP